MEELHVIDNTGKIVNRSKNLAGVIRFSGKHTATTIMICELPEGRGKLDIRFDNDKFTFTCKFESFTVLVQWIKNRKAMFGAALFINYDYVGRLDKFFKFYATKEG